MPVQDFFLKASFLVMHNGVRERGITYSLNCHKNTTAIRPDKLTVTSTHHGNHIALRISNDIQFSVIFPCADLFWRDCSHTPTAI